MLVRLLPDIKINIIGVSQDKRRIPYFPWHDIRPFPIHLAYAILSRRCESHEGTDFKHQMHPPIAIEFILKVKRPRSGIIIIIFEIIISIDVSFFSAGNKGGRRRRRRERNWKWKRCAPMSRAWSDALITTQTLSHSASVIHTLLFW